MAAPARRKIDLTELPGWARYLLAITVAVAVGGLAWMWGGRHGAPTWYLTGIRIAAVALILWTLVWILRKFFEHM